jgi:hypothetical protein
LSPSHELSLHDFFSPWFLLKLLNYTGAYIRKVRLGSPRRASASNACNDMVPAEIARSTRAQAIYWLPVSSSPFVWFNLFSLFSWRRYTRYVCSLRHRAFKLVFPSKIHSHFMNRLSISNFNSNSNSYSYRPSFCGISRPWSGMVRICTQ